MNQIPALTALRFVAALLVFLFHFPPPAGAWSFVAREGHIGVSIFFVLSGFLIALRYGEGLARGAVRLREYFVRRAARILPLYYAVFFLSLGLAHGDPPLSMGLLPELTLTQALFSESVHHLVIPTSWSLTVEECFYALAPLVFLAIARLRRRWPGATLTAAAAVLAVITGLLLVAGFAVWTLLDGRGPGFLRVPREVMIHTVFGRFYDFAIGVFTALLFAAPQGLRLRRVLARRWIGLLASVLASALVVLTEWGMHAAGGVDGPGWARAWAWEVLLAPATALLIVSLTAEANPVARALGAGPFVYLGKISYAFYLVQLTPLGKGLLYRVLPHGGLAPLLILYAGLTAVSVLLYELVEEPARRLVLRLAGLERETERAPKVSTLARLAGAGALSVALAVQCATWAAVSVFASLGPATLDEVRAAEPRGSDVITAEVAEMRWGRDILLVGLPRRWREGWDSDLRAPSALRVFVDGAPVPFSRGEPEHSERAAFFRGPRAELLALRVERVPEALVVVRESPATTARIHTARLLRSPGNAIGLAAFSAAILALAAIALGGGAVSPRMMAALAFGALAAWWTLGLHHERWSLGILAAECMGVLILALRATNGRPAAATPNAPAPAEQRA